MTVRLQQPHGETAHCRSRWRAAARPPQLRDTLAAVSGGPSEQCPRNRRAFQRGRNADDPRGRDWCPHSAVVGCVSVVPDQEPMLWGGIAIGFGCSTHPCPATGLQMPCRLAGELVGLVCPHVCAAGPHVDFVAWSCNHTLDGHDRRLSRNRPVACLAAWLDYVWLWAALSSTAVADANRERSLPKFVQAGHFARPTSRSIAGSSPIASVMRFPART